MESIQNLLQNPHNITHLTLGTLLHYLGKLLTQIFCWYSADVEKMQTKCIFIASNLVIHPQCLILLVCKITSCSPYWLHIKFYMSLFFYLFTFAINLWHRKLIAADVAAVFVNNQYSIQWRQQDFDKNPQIHSAYTVTHIKGLKSVHLKCHLFAFSSISAEYLQKFEFLISRGSVPTCLRWGR